MYKELVDRWNARQEAIKSIPYDRDLVQGLGMRFADEWKRLKPHICEDFDIRPEDFNYTLVYDIMPKIMLTIQE